MKRFLVITLVCWPSVALAIMGCLGDERDLAKRATTVALVSIEKVGTASVAACPESNPQTPNEVTLGGRTYQSGYLECGQVDTLNVTVLEPLRGEASGKLEILVGRQAGLVLGPCDDRPEVAKMAGIQAVLYLRREGKRWWTLDGPDSIYTFWPQPKLPPAFVARVKSLLAEQAGK